MNSEYISCADTAKFIRVALKDSFPGIKFSVRSRSYAGGASIDVEWSDGPAYKAVAEVAKVFEGSTFDGMIDLRSYHTSTFQGREVRFGADHVMCTRRKSRAFVQVIVDQYCRRYGMPLWTIEIVGTEMEANAYSNNLNYFEERELHDLLSETDAINAGDCYGTPKARPAQKKPKASKKTSSTTVSARKAAQEAQAKQEREAQAKRDQEAAEAKRKQEAKAAQERKEREAQAKREQDRRLRDEAERRRMYKNIPATREDALRALGLPLRASDSEIIAMFRRKALEARTATGSISKTRSKSLHIHQEGALQPLMTKHLFNQQNKGSLDFFRLGSLYFVG